MYARIPLIVAIVFLAVGGFLIATRESEPMAEQAAAMALTEEVAVSEAQLLVNKGRETQVPLECLMFWTNKDSNYITVRIEQKFNALCHGDPSSAPVFPNIRFEIYSEEVFMQGLDGEYHPYSWE